MSKSENKEYGKGSIVLLIGTSSAGKGTIIKELKRQDELKPESERLNWQEDGLDLEYRRYNSGNRPSFPKKIMENIYSNAINNSRNGLPTILDLVPLEICDNYDVVREFNKYCQSQNFSCPSIIALAHCDISTMVEHMDKRNASGDPLEKRDGFFPLKQYANTYYITNDDKSKTIGYITMGDVLNAANKYGDDNRGNVVLLENSKDAQEFIEKIGMAQDSPLDKPVKVTTDINYDVLYQTDPKNNTTLGSQATLQIAENITKLSTINSLMPQEPHPVAELIRQKEELEVKNKSWAENTKPKPISPVR